MAEHYVVLPPRSIHREVETPTVPVPGRRTSRRSVQRAEGGTMYRYEPALRLRQRAVKVVDELPGGGAKLVEIPDGMRKTVRLPTDGSRLVPVHTYRPAWPIPEPDLTRPVRDGAGIEFEVVCRKTSEPIAGATVTAVVDQDLGKGDSGITGKDGRVSLSLGGHETKIAWLSVKPPPIGWWGAWIVKPPTESPRRISLTPVSLTASIPDVLRHFYAGAKGADGKGVRIGVIDSGIADHPDLAVSGGANTVIGEDGGLYGDNGIGHGTQVAGIIGARGNPPRGVRGLAPEAELHSFRVYPQGSNRAGSFAIMAAITRALDAGCDLLNLSFEAPKPDEALEEAVKEAEAKGAVVIAAAGNGKRRPVAVPARYGTAVTALGRLSTFPSGSLQERYIAEPKGSDPENFLAGFSNIGPEVALTAPGLGVISTAPGGYAPTDGTSMATAAATGMAARLLSAEPTLLAMDRNQERSVAIRKLIARSARSIGFGARAEGYGML